MNVYKIIDDNFVKIQPGEDWTEIDNPLFITCVPDEMPSLMPVFKFDRSTVEECLSVDQYIKFESFEGYDFTTFNYINSGSKEPIVNEVNIYASGKYILFVFERDINDLCDLEENIVNKRYTILQKKGNILNKVYYLMFDRAIASYFKILEGLEDDVEDIEQKILINVDRNQLDSILTLKTRISRIRKYISPMVYIGDALMINDNEIISTPMEKYFVNLDLRINKLNDYANNLRHLINETRNAFDSKISSRTNDKATLITIIAAFFAPSTVIGAIYGMNFKFMPELNWPLGYPFALFLMVASSVIMYAVLKHKKWL